MTAAASRGLAILSAILVSACARHAAPEKPPRPVRVETVESETGGVSVRYSAQIEPYRQVSLAFTEGGYVREIATRSGPAGERPLQAGDEVRKGSFLARLRETEYQERVNQAHAQETEAQAGLAKAQQDFERAQKLYETKSLTRTDFDAARASLDAAQARLDGAIAQRQAAEVVLADCSLTAPIDALVLSRKIETGSLAGPGTVAFVIADVTRVKAVFGVPDHMAQLLRPGMSLPVTADALGTVEIKGRVTEVSPSADPQSRVFTVEVTIPNPDRRLKSGMVATVQVAESAAPMPGGRPVVPLTAVVRAGPDTEGYAVYVVEGPGEQTRARLRRVTLGPISGNRVAVQDGLRLAERVIVTGATLVQDGDAVRVIP